MKNFTVVDVHAHYHSRDEKERRVIMDELGRNGVAAALISSIGREHNPRPPAELVRGCNRSVAGMAREEARRIRWLAYLNPQLPDWPEELGRCLEEGASGIKLWISLKDEKGGMEKTSELLARAGEIGLPVLIHTYNRTWSDERTSGEISVEEFSRLAEKNPETLMIAAHSGGGGWRRSLGVLRERCPNTLLEVSGSYPELGMVEALVKEVGADRVLFGSDMPGRGLASQMAKVLLADLPDSDKEKIFSGNAARVFGLDFIEPPGPSHDLPGDEFLPDIEEDHFVFCGKWPFFKTPCDRAHGLDRLLAGCGTSRGYAADLSGLFSMDIESANLDFLEDARKLDRIRPLAVLDPRAQNWPSLLRRLPAGFAGILASPYIHNWRLDDTAYLPFFRGCAEKGFDVWINCALTDHRFTHPGFSPRQVSAAEILAFTKRAPGKAYVFQGANGPTVSNVLGEIGTQKKFRFEISRLTDGTGKLKDVLDRYGREPLAMGSEYPFRHPREVLYAARRR